MTNLAFENPVFRVYVIAAALLVLKMASMSWLTIYRLLKVGGGFRSPEDQKQGMYNRTPRDGQLAHNDYVDRARRIHQNDVENIPIFLIAGLIFVASGPSLWLAQVLLYGYVAARLLHFSVYLSAQSHEVRGNVWSIGSLILIGMTVMTLVQALQL